MHLFLDDTRKPHQVGWVNLPNAHWTIARNFDEFVPAVEKHGIPEFVAFDHDLAPEHYPFLNGGKYQSIWYERYKEKTGYHAAEWLVNRCRERGIPFPRHAIHTMNPVGKRNIERLIASTRE